jgi:hypothetical protein
VAADVGDDDFGGSFLVLPAAVEGDGGVEGHVVAYQTAARAFCAARCYLVSLRDAAEKAFPNELLSRAEVTRRLALTQLLWAESERNMVASVRD